MNGESRSGERSWEEWVEQLVQLPEQEQFTELLNKAKALKDKNSSLEHDIGDKLKKIDSLIEQTVYKDNEIRKLRHRCRDIEADRSRLKREGQKRIRRLRRCLVILLIISIGIIVAILSSSFL